MPVCFRHGGQRVLKAPPLTEELLLTAGGFWEKETKLPLKVWLLVGWPRSSGWFHYPQVYGQHKLESMGCKRGGEHKVGMGWGGVDLEGVVGKYDQNALHACLKSSKTKNYFLKMKKWVSRGCCKHPSLFYRFWNINTQDGRLECSLRSGG